jgi:hypothetical protein
MQLLTGTAHANMPKKIGIYWLLGSPSVCHFCICYDIVNRGDMQWLGYLAIIIPQSAIRFRQFRGKPVSPPVVLVAATFLAATGMVDVLLFFFAFDAFGRRASDQGQHMEMSDQEGTGV